MMNFYIIASCVDEIDFIRFHLYWNSMFPFT